MAEWDLKDRVEEEENFLWRAMIKLVEEIVEDVRFSIMKLEPV